MAWLLDTNILSEIRRLRPEPKVLAFIAGYPLGELYVSVVTLAELRFCTTAEPGECPPRRVGTMMNASFASGNASTGGDYNALYTMGGPRTVQLAVKLLF
jgi:hypothetical protein